MISRRSRLLLFCALAGLAASLPASAQQLAAERRESCGELIDQPIKDPAAQADLCTRALAVVVFGSAERAGAYMVRARAHESLGEADAARLDYREAIVNYGKAIEFGGPDEKLFYRRAVAHHALHEVDLALADYAESIRRGSSDPAVFINRGILLAALGGNVKAAIADFDKALAIAPWNVAAMMLRGEAHAQLGEKAEAKADLDRAVSALPGHSAPYLARARVARQAGLRQEAQDDYGRALTVDPDNIEALSGRALLELGAGDYGRAIADLDRAIRLRPRDARAYFNRGYAHFARGDFEPAIADYSAALRVDPTMALAYNNRCLARAVAGQDAGSVMSDCQEALARAPDSVEVHETRGFVFLKLGNVTAALTEYEAVLKADPRRPNALYGRGLARLQQGNGAGERDKQAARTLNSGVDRDFVALVRG